MSIINNGLLLASGADAATTYQISRSLRFNSADSAYLSRTPASAGNRKTWTWSAWVKRTNLGYQIIFNARSGGEYHYLSFDTNDELAFRSYSGGFQLELQTTAKYRDPSAWYHILINVDTTAATPSNRASIYINGTKVTAFNTATYPSQNTDLIINTAYEHNFGRFPVANDYGNFMLADVYFLDGTATTPSTFAETDAVTGQWVPKTPTGISYGSNGFRLSFSDNSGTTSTTLGKDAAGSNNWSPNNFSVASGSGNDSLTDTPTSYGTDTGAGNEVRGNYATLNPLVNISGHTFRNGNLEAVTSSSNYGTFVSTIAMPPSGKWYAEAYISATSGYPLVGIAGTGCTFGTTSYLGGQATMYAYYGVNGNKYNNGTSSSYGATYTTGDTIGIAYDADAGTITFYKNGVSQGQAYSGITSGSYYFAGNEFNSASGTQIWNFGQRPFAYTAPSGFKALCDTNLGTPTIIKPSTVFDVKLWTGNGSSQTISGLNFSPDFLWTSVRDVTGYFKYLVDSIRGSDKYLVSFNINAEGTDSQGITSLTSSGFTVGSSAQVNENGRSMVAWCWDAGTSTVTNNNGTISSQVRANASAGFSIVSWSANNTANQSIGHGLGVTPAFIIHKNRTTAGNWNCWFTGFSNDEYINLNGTGAKASTGGGLWYQTPTSSLFYIGFTGSAINNSTDAIISYCFAPVTGYSNAFTYSGTGSTDGPFCFLGFRPRLILLKVSNTTGPWYLFDTARNTYNVMNNRLEANSNSAEASDRNVIDALSNGFKLRDVDAVWNQSGNTYIGFAWAESPFQYSRAR